MPLVIKNQAGEVKSGIIVLRDYFGMKEAQTLQDFMAEVKALKPEDKEELVRLAAKELGYSMTE